MIARLVAIPAVIALGAAGSQLLFAALHKPDAVLAQPLPVVTTWGASGVVAWLFYAATMAIAGVFYLRVIFSADVGRVKRGTIVAVALAAMLAAFAFRFLFSSDVYAYAAYGALAATQQNPYVHRLFPPAQLVDAHWTAAIGYEWPSLPACIYGPAFVLLAQGIVLATHFSLAHALLALRLLEIAAFSAAIALAPNAILAATVGLNPVVISTVAEGHNDALILLVVALSYLLARRSDLAGGVLAGLSSLLKATGGVAALGVAYALGSKRFAWSAVGALVASFVLQYAATRAWGGYSTPAATDFVGTPQAALAMVLRGIAALVAAFWALRCAGSGARARALASGAFALWALYPNDYPWYGVWVLAVAAFTLHEREGRALLALSFTSTLRYLSDVYGYAPAAPWLEVLALAIPLVVYAKTSSNESVTGSVAAAKSPSKTTVEA